MQRRWAGARRRGKTARRAGAALPAAASDPRVRNRVDRCGALAIHGPRSERSRAVMLTVTCRGANSRSASAHRRPIDQGRRSSGGCRTATCSRRDSAVGKTVRRRSERRRADSPLTVRELVIDTILRCRSDDGRRRRHRQHARGDPIFRADEPEPPAAHP